MTNRKTFIGLLGIVVLQDLMAQDDLFHVTTDFVYLQRHSADNTTIAVDTEQVDCVDGCFSNNVLDINDLTPGYTPGLKFSLGCSPVDRSTYEVDFLYLWEMEGSETKHPKGILSAPFRPSFVSDYIEVDSLYAQYQSQFYTGELNYLYRFSTGKYSYFGLSGLFGLRFTNLSERFLLEVEKAHNVSDYRIKANNDLLGIQLGFDFHIRPNRYFDTNLVVKGGADLNRIATKIQLNDLDHSVTLRNYNKQETQTGVFAEIDIGLHYLPLSWLSIHMGYEMLYFGGLALAPDQITFSSDEIKDTLIEGAPRRVFDDGYIILYGIFAGVSFTF